MKYIVKAYPEIMMKSESVRKRFMQMLANNIREILRRIDETTAVVRHWDFIEVRHKEKKNAALIEDALTRISGIHHFLVVEELAFNDVHHIFEQVYERVKDELENKTFCVRVKRRGQHDFSSMDVMCYVGGGLNQRIASAKVKLDNPDVTVRVDIEQDRLFFIQRRVEGLGGFPMGTQESVLSLISGGFDSAAASYLFMRRGSRVHFCFFNLGGQTHKLGVQEMAYHLWQRYSSSHRVQFIAVDFEPVVAEILTKIDDGQMGVVLKRMMVRAASEIAARFKIEALVTGEAMGQVSSQTLTNLRRIDEVSDTLILRPLIAHDKADIIKLCEETGTALMAKAMPEFCGVISKSPTVKAKKEKLAAAERNFDFSILERAIETATVSDIKTLAEQKLDSVPKPEVLSEPKAGQVLLDIRSPDEVEENPLNVALPEGARLECVPFYRLMSAFETGELSDKASYLLYCEQGVMSGLQAVQLLSKGVKNVAVFKPKSV